MKLEQKSKHTMVVIFITILTLFISLFQYQFSDLSVSNLIELTEEDNSTTSKIQVEEPNHLIYQISMIKYFNILENSKKMTIYFGLFPTSQSDIFIFTPPPEYV